jgi:hypothetical protein
MGKGIRSKKITGMYENTIEKLIRLNYGVFSDLFLRLRVLNGCAIDGCSCFLMTTHLAKHLQGSQYQKSASKPPKRKHPN